MMMTIERSSWHHHHQHNFQQQHIHNRHHCPYRLRHLTIGVVVNIIIFLISAPSPLPLPHSGELRTQKLKVPSGENKELKCSPFKTWSRSVYNHTCYAYCQGFLPCLFLPFRSIQLHFFQNLSRFFLCWLWLTHGSCVGPQNKIGHPAGCRFPC